MANPRRTTLVYAALLALLVCLAPPVAAEEEGQPGDVGYYREPALRGDTLVFVAEGDLWRVPVTGGVARRLTTHAGAERGPSLSPDGSVLAFTARYEGPRELYTMSPGGGRPTRHTFGLRRGWTAGFTNDGRVVYVTRRYATLPDQQLVVRDVESGTEERVPLAQADQAAWSADGKTLYFTRLPFQGSHCKRYKGGAVQNLWRYRMDGSGEAVPLSGDHLGTDKNPMTWKGRLYFLSDRDGTMNVWSMDPEGKSRDLKQVTHQDFLDIKEACLDAGRIVYRVGADLRLVDLAAGTDDVIPITIPSDLEHTRARWVTDPFGFLTSSHVSPDGKRVALISRGRMFTAPVGKGRLIEIPRQGTARCRAARFSHDGKTLHYLCDASDEVELWSRPADGTGRPEQLTTGATILRYDHLASPDGAWIAHYDKLARLWIRDTKSGEEKVVEDVGRMWVSDLAWSPDGRWLAYEAAPPQRPDHGILRLYDTKTGTHTDLTTDRYSSVTPAFGREGKWLYFLSDRSFSSMQRSPWGARQPEPFFDRPTRIYALALKPGLRSPFQEPDEVHEARQAAKKKEDAEKAEEKKKADQAKKPEAGKEPAAGKKPGAKDEAKKPKPVEIELAGLSTRLYQLPVPPGNYRNLVAAKGHLLWIALDDLHARSKHGGARRDLKVLKIGDDKAKVKTRMADVASVELSGDGSKLLVRAGKSLYVIPADSAAAPKGDALADAKVDLSGWRFAVDPLTEWQQMFHDAWRLHRDYFYDPNLHGVNWKLMRERYAGLVERVRDRADLQDLTGMLISELSALHASVGGGEHRKGADDVAVGCLGARFRRDVKAGGYVLEHVFESDPDEPALRSPLARQDLDLKEGDVLVAVNNRPAPASRELGELLLGQVGRQVRLTFRREGTEKPVEAVVKPISTRAEAGLRYHEWEYTRRLETEKLGDGRLGYLHLRAMGSGDIAQFTRHYYPVSHREGLIIDVRHNGGGNIDAWILSRLLRKAWMHWQGRAGEPYPNMHFAPRGHLIVLCDHKTASDGEAFAEGFKRLGLGPVLGTRTWGGEIWLSRSNRLADGGVASAGMNGVFGPAPDGSKQIWLVEGHGVDPDMVVDNLPHETFEGRDRQLEAAVKHLLEKLETDPRPMPKPPPYPDKSFPNNR